MAFGKGWQSILTMFAWGRPRGARSNDIARKRQLGCGSSLLDLNSSHGIGRLWWCTRSCEHCGETTEWDNRAAQAIRYARHKGCNNDNKGQHSLLST
ncbi:hypothetical protein V6N12_029404 [Hibiscus sabdariffa]|uniref:Uncharacterized protein n=1 Tax=Hibiscus sabdariffa TaxID=183260 RepID=A0ABR2CW12_9ROSI